MSTKKNSSSKKNNNMYYIVGAVVAALVVAGALIAVSMSGGDDGAAATADPATAALVLKNVEGIEANGLTLGDPKAPVTITEYADVACIHCRDAALQSVPDVITNDVRTGKAKIVFAPTAFISASSERGALGIIAAGEQDAAWPFADMLFHMQGNASTDWLSDADMEDVAAQLGLDVDAWRTAYQGAEVEAEFLASRDAVLAAGVNSTPTFIVKGPGGTERIEGAVPAAQISNAVAKVTSLS